MFLKRFNHLLTQIIKESSETFETDIDNSITTLTGEDNELTDEISAVVKNGDKDEIAKKYLCIVCQKYVEPEKNNGHLTCPKCGLTISTHNF